MAASSLFRRYCDPLCKIYGITAKYSDEADEPVVELDGWVYITASEKTVTRPSIVGDRQEQRLVYTVSQAVTIPGSYWEPEDMDITDVGDHETMGSAIREAFLCVVSNIIDQSMEATGMDLWCEQRELEEQVF